MAHPRLTHRLTSAALLLALSAGCASQELRRAPARGDYGPTVDRSPLYDDVLEVPFQLDVLFGVRDYASDGAWAPLDDPFTVGLAMRTPLPGQRYAGFDLAFRYAFDEARRGTTEYESQMAEVDAGLVLAFAPPGQLLQPFVGAGLAILFTDNEVTPETGDGSRNRDGSIGHYLRGGVHVEFAPGQLVGIELRFLDGDDAMLEDDAAPLQSFEVSIGFGARF